jgi:hypothetical protein
MPLVKRHRVNGLKYSEKRIGYKKKKIEQYIKVTNVNIKKE